MSSANVLSDINTQVIADPENITPHWLTDVLRRNGFAPEVRTVNVLLTKQLPISTVCRIGIEYERTTDAPQNLFLKLCTRQGCDDIGRKEVEFYREVSPAMSCPPLVRCYDTAFSEETGRAHILLEDLFETHSQPEQENAPTIEMSRLAIEALAKAHAHWWSSPKLGNGIGELFDDEALQNFLGKLEIEQFLKSEGDTLRSEQRDACKKILKHADKIWGRLTRSHYLTVTHGDLHWWNFLYPKNTDTHAVRLFDWHLWHIDLAARDLAFLLALGGFAEPRPESETRLLRVYHDTLTANGVSGYTWEMLDEDYRWSAIRNLNVAVVFWSQGKHYSTWQTTLRRSFESFERLNCAELIA